MDETTLNQAFATLAELYDKGRITEHEYASIFDALASGEAYWIANRTGDTEE